MRMDSEIAVLAFAAHGTRHPDAFVVVNLGQDKQVRVNLRGTPANAFAGFRTTEDEKQRFAPLGTFPVNEGALLCDAPGGSATTFFAVTERK